MQDRRGDGAAGVQTLPVVLGPRGALAFCLALLAACSALAVSAALQGSGLAWAWAGRPALEAPLRCAALGCVAWVLSYNVASTLGVLRSRFGREEVRPGARAGRGLAERTLTVQVPAVRMTCTLLLAACLCRSIHTRCVPCLSLEHRR